MVKTTIEDEKAKVIEIAGGIVTTSVLNSWPNPGLPSQELEISRLSKVLDIVGFKQVSVELGRVLERPDDGGKLSDPFFINRSCPYKVVGNKTREDHYDATVWLDKLFHQIKDRFSVLAKTESDFDLVVTQVKEEVCEMIFKNLHFSPIILTADGDTLGTDANSKNPLRDIYGLNAPFKMHSCGCQFSHYEKVNRFQQVLRCEGCGFRLALSRKIETLGDLRDWSQAREAARWK